MAKAESIYKKLGNEVGQGFSLRQPIYKRFEEELGGNKRVVALFTSFSYTVQIEDEDADMLEEMLAITDLDDRELVLLLNSPGGDGMAAERIVNIFRSYSSKHFTVVVPKMAKSAATMISLGADEILMSNTSELGPIDPQILIRDEDGNPVKYQAAHEITDAYYTLVSVANETKGRLEPYLQQLARFDARDIRHIESLQNLSEGIAVSLLRKGMMKGKTDAYIKRKIKPLTDPEITIDHGRALFSDAAKDCGLNVTLIKNTAPIWRTVWELYVRLNHLTNTISAKAIETVDESYVAPAPRN